MGMRAGQQTTQADAIRAYVQAVLSSQYNTYVRTPYDLWPQEWKDVGMKVNNHRQIIAEQPALFQCTET